MSGSPAVESKETAPCFVGCGAARMSHKETWPSSCDVASCGGMKGLRFRLVTARATVQLQTQQAAAMSQTRTEESQEPLTSVKGKLEGAPNSRQVTTCVWPCSENLGTTPAPPGAALLLPAPAASGCANREASVFQRWMSRSQPPLAICVPSSLMATACTPFRQPGARSVATVPAAALAAPPPAASPCFKAQHLSVPSLHPATRLLPFPPSTGKAATLVSSLAAILTTSRDWEPSYSRTVPSQTAAAKNWLGHAWTGATAAIQSGTSSTCDCSGSLRARTYSKVRAFSEESLLSSRNDTMFMRRNSPLTRKSKGTGFSRERRRFTTSDKPYLASDPGTTN
mmetsp:Transcript_10577/g.21845  ORF Transcript_10577/g.21845 Transcript_10577/m.21845 type:complete len:340 (+) Transcript_10577:376-1395(+)